MAGGVYTHQCLSYVNIAKSFTLYLGSLLRFKQLQTHPRSLTYIIVYVTFVRNSVWITDDLTNGIG